MCIIVAVPAGVEIPSDEVLRECFESNPDGAGFMYSDGKRVRIRKGFMTWDEFKSALDAELDAGLIFKESAVVLHFRIATHGKVKPMCCHPFPVSDEPSDLRATSIDARWGIAHNGVIHGMETNKSWSDSMDFVAGVVTPLARMNSAFMHSEDAIELLETACQGSRLAIVDNAGDLALVGRFVEDGGVFYSNTSYLPTRWNYSSYGDWWSKSLPTSTEDMAWDAVERRVEQLSFGACQLCPNAVECAEYMEFCENEYEAIEACADANGCKEQEVIELLEWDGYEAEDWQAVYDLG